MNDTANNAQEWGQEWEWTENTNNEQTNFPACSLQSTAPGVAFRQCTSSFEDCFKCPLNKNKQ